MKQPCLLQIIFIYYKFGLPVTFKHICCLDISKYTNTHTLTLLETLIDKMHSLSYYTNQTTVKAFKLNFIPTLTQKV